MSGEAAAKGLLVLMALCCVLCGLGLDVEAARSGII